MSVDTLSLAKERRAADFALPQAEAIAAAIGRSVTETIATKADLGLMRAELVQIEDRLGARIDKHGSDLRLEIEKSRNALLFWFIGTQVAIGGIVVALVKLIPAQG